MPRQSGVLIYTALLCTVTGINRAQEGPWQAAPTASNPTLSFGMIGFGMAGIARLNVVNLVRTPPPSSSLKSRARWSWIYTTAKAS